ncbi:hypothetical protein ACSFA8_00030 [Variovorax sp. RT4R15]|uniref:hypothetical protein n=1 Tax=Variovorax sp. RT4R15 TaxID=3443737 RepID=UPI003F4754D4
MSLANLMKKGSLRALATVTVATVATDKPQEAPTVAEVATVAVANPLDKKAANDPATDADRWCWPHSDAMNTVEIDVFTLRVVLFTDRGASQTTAEALADKLVKRDRDGDDRRMCVECSNLSGWTGSRRCGAWPRAGLGGQAIPSEWIALPQRCAAFAENSEKTAPTHSQLSNEEPR